MKMQRVAIRRMPDTGAISQVAFEVQAERVMAQLKHCLETAGSSLRHVLKCNVYCTPEPSHFAAFNAIYDRYFAEENPARIFVQVPSCNPESLAKVWIASLRSQ
jgi:2-iminobutanoate/2-iminopropanoate deaminase